jgi:hypothetical protein
MEIVFQSLSLVGAGLILVAYMALQRRRVSSSGKTYLWANFLGAALLAIVAIRDRRAGFILLESLWAVVSLWSIVTRPWTRQPIKTN